jgi:murein DD-endopeptidase MepM/ murein hydrolase activator NlpD
MRRIVIAGVLVVALVVAVPVGAFVTARNASVDSCGTEGASQALTGPVPKVQGLSSAQVRLAQLIWSRAQRHAGKLDGKPDQAAIIAIAVASQESTLGAHPAINRPNRDGDAGPFQQRAKPGWYGSLAQVTDPVYAADTFLLGHTVTSAQHAAARAAGSQPAGPVGYHIPGLANVASWPSLDIIDAAHRVQRSAFPDAIADDIPLARRLVDLFTSDSPASADGPAVAVIDRSESADCGSEAAPTRCPPTGSSGEQGLEPDTLLVLRCVKQAFPKIETFYGVRDDPDSDHSSGRAVDVMISSAWPNYRAATAVSYGDRMAAWIAANHQQLGVRYIIWRQRIWNVERASEGWRPMSDRGNPTANHYDHLHVSTYGDAAKPVEPDTGASDVQAVMPVERYTITARFGQVGSWARYHTGLDFAAAIGTPVRAALGGTVTHSGYRSTASWAGDFVTVRHPDGTSTLYAHLARHEVRIGEAVTAGQQIGAIGMSGRSFGPHLHFEVYPQNVSPGRVYLAVDPMSWLRSHDALQG